LAEMLKDPWSLPWPQRCTKVHEVLSSHRCAEVHEILTGYRDNQKAMKSSICRDAQRPMRFSLATEIHEVLTLQLVLLLITHVAVFYIFSLTLDVSKSSGYLQIIFRLKISIVYIH
jgi:Fe2+ transport system protein B